MKKYIIYNDHHNGKNYYYHAGLNIDPTEFHKKWYRPLYYSETDIFAFLDTSFEPTRLRNNLVIREVTVPDNANTHDLQRATGAKYTISDRLILGKKRKINISVIKKLIDEGADVHVNNNNVIWYFACVGDFSCVKYLVDTFGFPDNSNDMLYVACRNGYYNIVKYFIDHGAADAKYPILIQAATDLYYNPKLIKLLVMGGADIYEFHHQTLRFVCEKGDLGLIKFLITEKYKNNPDQFESLKKGRLLHIAVSCGYLEIVKYLIKNGIGDITDELLKTAVYKGYTDIAKYLIENGLKSKIITKHILDEAKEKMDEDDYNNLVKYLKNKKRQRVKHCLPLLRK